MDVTLLRVAPCVRHAGRFDLVVKPTNLGYAEGASRCGWRLKSLDASQKIGVSRSKSQ